MFTKIIFTKKTYISVASDLDLWPFDLKIDAEVTRIHNQTKYKEPVRQPLSLNQKIKRHGTDRQRDRQTDGRTDGLGAALNAAS